METNKVVNSNPIGFLSFPQTKPHLKHLSSQEKGSTLITFDSGSGIKLDEANHNVMILGRTGCGKTTSVVTPMLCELIEKGLGGLIFDVKNNFTQYVHKMAISCGREEDIIEIGTYDTAKPINILKGLSLEVIHQMLESMIMNKVENSPNADWHYKGTRMTQQVASTLYYLDIMKPNEGLAPSLALIARIINDIKLAQETWRYYLSCMDLDDPDQQNLKAEVESDNFCIFTPPKKESSVRQKDEWNQQITWKLSMPRKVLGEFAAKNLANKLSALDGFELNIHDLILNQNKVVVIRFSPKFGGPGSRLATMIKEQFYRTIYCRYDDNNLAKKIPYVFCVMDEFQDILNLDENSSLDDFSWFSKAREFNVINVVATQSMASLYKNGLEYRVKALLSNFGCKIIMQNDDPETEKWANYLDANCPLQKLKSAEAIVAKFAIPQRELIVNIEQVQEIHDIMKYKLDSISINSASHDSKEIGFDITRIRTKLQDPVWTQDSEVLKKIYEIFPRAFAKDSLVSLNTDNPDITKALAKIVAQAAHIAQEKRLTFSTFIIAPDHFEIETINNSPYLSTIRNTVEKMLATCFNNSENSPFN